MAVEKNSDINITYNSEIVGKIGLSKTINNYTAEELWDFALCTSQWDFMQNFKNCNNVYNDVAIGINSDRENFPIYYSGSTNPSYSSAIIKYDKGVQSYNNPEGVYARVIWLKKTESGNFKRSITNTSNGYQVITNCDWNKVLWNVQSGYEINGYNVSGEVWSGIKSPFFHLKYLLNGEYVEVSALNDIAPYLMFKIDNNICIYQAFGGLNTLFHYHIYVGRSSEIWSKSYSDILTGVEEWNGSSQISSFDGNNHYVLSLNLNTSLYSTDYYDLPYEYNIYAGVYGGGWSGCYTTDIEGIGAYIDSPKENKSGGIFYAPCNPETYRLLCSLCGVIFQDDKIYKPIIKDGYVSGYTDNLTAESDIDNYTYDSGMGHEVPDKKPDPNLEDDNSDDINFGGSYAGLGAFAKFYLCSGVEISQLNSWINGRSPDWPENFDPMTQIISISRFATDLSSASFGSTTIKFHTAAGAEIDTKIPALHGNGDNIELDLGSVDIPLRMKERGIPFLDYESTIELYIPACGTFILDPQTVLGSTLSVKMWLSTSTGECNSIAYVTRNGVKAPVAYGSGSLAVPMPVTSVGWGSYLAAVTNATIRYSFGALNTIGSEFQWISSGFTGNQFGSASGMSGSTGSFQNMAQAEQNLAHLKNSSFTSVSGSFGSTASWNYPFNAYVKITRRHFKKPSNYAHTRGIPLVETKTLRDCSGFTICVNADVSSINATIQEKNMIVDALNNGVIV